MARASISEPRWLARAFLTGLASVTAWSVWSGTPPAAVALVPCPVRTLTGIPCPGCGMTRACVALARGELNLAWLTHPGAFALVPLALAFALWPRTSERAWTRLGPRVRRLSVGLGLALTLGLWCARLLAG